MTYPVGVATTTIVFGKGIAVDGSPLAASLTVEPVFSGTTRGVVWTADGTPLIPVSVSRTADSGTTGSIELPVVDQPGWVDDGQAPITMWAYRLTETVSGRQRVKYLQPLTGQGVIDFDRIPDGSVGLPVSAPVVAVLDVAGLTGSVGAQQLADTLAPLIPDSGGGAVASVNGYTGAVTLTAPDVGAATTVQGEKADTAVQPDRTVAGYALTSDVPRASLDTVGVGGAVFIANGGTVPAGTPAYTIVIEAAA
ncbi:MAG: hypothetical protein QM630_01690 [Microbacterium sp.]